MSVHARSELIDLLRKNALIKSSEAWSRMDGGHDLSIGAMLAEQSADAMEELQSELAATKAALAEVETAMSNTNETLQRLGEQYGCQPGSRRIDWLKEHLANSAARVAKLEAALACSADALKEAREWVLRAPEDTWGTNAVGDGTVPGGLMSWPMRDELAHNIQAAELKSRAALVQEAGRG